MNEYETICASDAIYLDATAFPKIVGIEEDTGSRIGRVLVYLSTIPVFTSLVGFGEFVSFIGKKRTQNRIGASGFLFHCRSLMADFDIKKIQRVEPPNERIDFVKIADRLVKSYHALGGGDIWHLIAALELRKNHRSVIFLTLDQDLRNAAEKEGFSVVDPTNLDSNKLSEELQRSSKSIVE